MLQKRTLLPPPDMVPDLSISWPPRLTTRWRRPFCEGRNRARETQRILDNLPPFLQKGASPPDSSTHRKGNGRGLVKVVRHERVLQRMVEGDRKLGILGLHEGKEAEGAAGPRRTARATSTELLTTSCICCSRERRFFVERRTWKEGERGREKVRGGERRRET